MKFNFTPLLVFVFLIASINLYSQKISSTLGGGEYQFNDSQTPCLTDAQRENILAEIKSNILVLKSQNRLAYDKVQQRAAKTLFSWPIKKKEGLPYNDVWAISNYVDQNLAYPNQLLDYNCGTKTYDTNAGYNHLGIDVYTWPFSWKMMDNDEAEIVAAAAGQIIDIGRGAFDRSCAFNDNAWNAVYVQHADGSVALYGHMKKNSPTNKKIGDMVERGEYLGIVGSSGNSTGPHLHFEVYSSINPDVLIDPYAGNCNSLNQDSWWQEQKPYVDPNINAVLTHSAPPIFPSCPDQETANEKDAFATGEMVYLAVYLRDQIKNTPLYLEIIRPDGTIFTNWTFDLTENYGSSYWYWRSTIPTIAGNWTWRATYQGKVVDHKFTVGTLDIAENDFEALSIYPNPFNDIIHIKSNSPVKKLNVTNILGTTVLSLKNESTFLEQVILETLSNGLYFLTLEGDANQKKTIKIIKE